MNSLALIVVLAALNAPMAIACNPNNPMDLSCPPGYFLNRTFGSIQYYANNGPARWAQIAGCTHPTPLVHENPQWCAAAMQAQRLTTGAR